MIKVTANKPEVLYKKAFVALYDKRKQFTSTFELQKEDSATLSVYSSHIVENVIFSGKSFESQFYYSQFIKDGNNRAEVEFRYYQSKLVKTKKIERIASYLRSNKDSKRAIVSIWEDKHTNTKVEAPCLIYLNFTERKGELILNCHQRASDAYKMLLLDIEIVRAIQIYVAKKINKEVGICNLFIDSLHFYKQDIKEVNKLYKRLNKERR